MLSIGFRNRSKGTQVHRYNRWGPQTRAEPKWPPPLFLLKGQFSLLSGGTLFGVGPIYHDKRRATNRPPAVGRRGPVTYLVL